MERELVLRSPPPFPLYVVFPKQPPAALLGGWGDLEELDFPKKMQNGISKFGELLLGENAEDER